MGIYLTKAASLRKGLTLWIKILGLLRKEMGKNAVSLCLQQHRIYLTWLKSSSLTWTVMKCGPPGRDESNSCPLQPCELQWSQICLSIPGRRVLLNFSDRKLGPFVSAAFLDCLCNQRDWALRKRLAWTWGGLNCPWEVLLSPLAEGLQCQGKGGGSVPC